MEFARTVLEESARPLIFFERRERKRDLHRAKGAYLDFLKVHDKLRDAVGDLLGVRSFMQDELDRQERGEETRIPAERWPAVGSNVFAWHGYTLVHLEGRWLKASPTFNRTLCEKLGVAPLPFDGRSDALLQPYDGEGRDFMAYLADHGAYFDVPMKFLVIEMARLYPKLCVPGGMRGSMEREARE